MTGLKTLDNGKPIDVIYLDFSKAFDKVPIKHLESRLEHIGIRGLLVKWISAFLNHRSFNVKVGNDKSTTKPVTSGVPQGSVLGPVLFLIYTADLINQIVSKNAVYADDIKIYGNPQTKSQTLQSDLDVIKNWCDD